MTPEAHTTSRSSVGQAWQDRGNAAPEEKTMSEETRGNGHHRVNKAETVVGLCVCVLLKKTKDLEKI